ncbi:hypothetical protein SCA03_03980 [Streptomyces cacaoi]|uniref:Uncharacterized protein n=1 Tax=Streptomyces cacaoi TaxID=1898 RepID=A0A4Y3QT56_STRCI|nr:hypothetical protein SCA03_03980 [Streptomyces cacaoi]
MNAPSNSTASAAHWAGVAAAGPSSGLVPGAPVLEGSAGPERGASSGVRDTWCCLSVCRERPGL